MNLKWLKKTPKHEREAFKTRLLANHDIFELFKEILEEELDTVIHTRRSLKSYLTQNWAAYQADRNATERTYQEIIDLLPIED